MKKTIYSLLVLIICFTQTFAVESAKRLGVVSIDGIPTQYDTLLHRHIGPGTTYTQLQFDNLKYGNNVLAYKMRAHIFTIDLTDPYQCIRAYNNTEDYFKGSSQQQMYRKEQAAGRKPFASSAGFLFYQTSHQDGTARSNELIGNYVIQNETRYVDRRPTPCFYVAGDGIAHIETMMLNASMTTASGSYAIAQINHCRDRADSISSLTLFCNDMPSWSPNGTNGVDVLMKVASNGGRIGMGSNTCQIVSILNGSGHKPAVDECIVSACGTMESVLRGLQVGETVTITVNMADATGALANFENLFSVRSIPAIREGELILFNKKSTAYIFLGISKDGKTVYLTDLEISNNSNAPTDAFACLMKEIGVYTGNWMDGGPSAEMIVDGQWVTVNSIGGGFNGRYLPGAILLYSEAPDDDTIARVEMYHPSAKTMTVGEHMRVNLYGYSKYGEMIDPSAERSSFVTIWSDAQIGQVDENGIFYATREGSGYIYVQVEGQTEVQRMAVTVKSAQHLSIYPDRLFTGEGRRCQLQLFVENSNNRIEIPANEANWKTSSKYVVSSCSDGLIEPYVDGYAEVMAEYNGLTDTIGVIVENLEDLVDELDLTDDIRIVYTQKKHEMQLPSVPHGFGLTLTCNNEADIVVRYQLGNGKIEFATVHAVASTPAELLVAVDYDAVDTYPVVIKSIAVSKGTFEIDNLTAYYTSIDHIDSIEAGQETIYYNILGQQSSRPDKGFHISNRKKIIHITH